MKNKQDALVALSVILCALVLLGALVFSISGNPFKKPSLSFTVDFSTVAGISPNSPVYYAGQKIGRVESLEQLAPNSRIDPDAVIRLHISITEQLEIPSNIEISITSDSMLGERYVSIRRVDDSGGSLSGEAQLLANAPSSMLETLIPGGSELLSDLRIIATNLKTFTSDLNSKKGGKNLSDSFENLSEITTKVKTILSDESGDIEELLGQIHTISDNLLILSNDLNDLVSGPEGNPEKGVITRADRLLTGFEDLSRELNLTIRGTSSEPGLRQKANRIADELDAILAGADNEAGMRERLNSTISKLDSVLLETQALIIWGEYITGTLAERPSRLIFGSELNEVPTKEQIVEFLRNNDAPYPVIIKGNSESSNANSPQEAGTLRPNTGPNPSKPRSKEDGLLNHLFNGN
tara:strand:- start:5039 stop:6265 length:1227 start_codon:yes stop_codon:yes gene_type:complete